MSSKYETNRQPKTRVLNTDRGTIGLTDHSLHRWNERTPHDCPVSVQEAFYSGEWIRHPSVARSPDDPRDPEMARVYKHQAADGSEWGVVWLIVDDEEVTRVREHVGEMVAVTCCSFDTIEHGPSRAYLHGHGPHVGGR